MEVISAHIRETSKLPGEEAAAADRSVAAEGHLRPEEAEAAVLRQSIAQSRR